MKKFILFTFIIVSNISFSQTFNQYLKAGEKSFNKGEYFAAISYYKKATLFKNKLDDVNYKIGQSYLELKDYNQSLKYFSKVRTKSSYPFLSYKMANSLMLTGDYNQAIKYYNGFKNNYRTEDFYSKNTDQQIAACYWVLDQSKEKKDIIIESIDKNINTEYSEFSASYFKDSALQVTSFFQDEENKMNDYESDILFFEKKKDSYKEIEINIPRNEKLQMANGCYVKKKNHFYFNQCEATKDGKKRCDLYVTEYKDNKWSEPIFLNINEKKATNTQAFVYVNTMGKDVIFFVSDREGGIGKKDIWTATETTYGVFENLEVLPESINTIHDEASPFYNAEKGTLYFSSKWHYGFGGYDIFKAKKLADKYSKATNIGKPYNSSANDLYFSINDIEKGLLSSNRTGAMKLRGASCCYDIFSFEKDMKTIVGRKDSVSRIDSLLLIHKIDSAEIILNKIREMMPITVYFHNDEPNPKTEDTTTTLLYSDAYNSFNTQKNEYYKMNNFKEIDAFFYDYLEKGYTDLKAFKGLLVKLLPNNKIQLETKGYCSPLAENDYNIKLSKRRISSIENELKANKVLNKAFEDNKLSIKESPFGEEKADENVSDDYYNTKLSIFDPAACKERKVSIIGIFVK